jgi:hypothetical protein
VGVGLLRVLRFTTRLTPRDCHDVLSECSIGRIGGELHQRRSGDFPARRGRVHHDCNGLGVVRVGFARSVDRGEQLC